MACKLCGKEDTDFSHYGECSEKKLMRAEQICFRCAFWRTKEARKDDPHQLVINGNMYYYFEDTDKKDKERASWRGFGGRRHFIRSLSTGEVFTTDNLWHNGEIPAHFRKIFPNTHEWAQREEM